MHLRTESTFVAESVPAGPARDTHTTSRMSAIGAAIGRRIDETPAWVLVIELFIGLGWIRAATEKVISSGWWTGGELDEFAETQLPLALGWYRPFLEYLVIPFSAAFALAVVVLQVAVGSSLLVGRRRGAALATGMFLNLHFVAAGAVDPSVFYLLAQGAVALWLAELSLWAGTPRALLRTAGAGVGFALASLPWVRTVHPERVIEDPALMFVTGGLLTAVACLVAHRHISYRRRLGWAEIDLRTLESTRDAVRRRVLSR